MPRRSPEHKLFRSRETVSPRFAGVWVRATDIRLVEQAERERILRLVDKHYTLIPNWDGLAPAPLEMQALGREITSLRNEVVACTGCANGCAGCKWKGKPYGQSLVDKINEGGK